MKLQTTLNLLLASTAAAVLFACGGGGGDSSTVAAGAGTQSSAGGGSGTPTTAASSVVQNIDYYGDSTVWGWASGSTGTQVANPAPAVFAAQLPAAARYAVHNEGVSGTTACQLLNGTDGRHPDWATQLHDSNAKFVIVNHGINDFNQENLNQYTSCLTSIATIAKQAGKILIFETPNPTYQSGQGLENFVASMRTVAASHGLKVIDQYQNLLTILNGNDPSTLMPDGIHPNDATYALKGRFAATEFLKMSF